MNENEQGLVFPFRLSGNRMRRSADTYRRCGQPLDALTLVRRAAEQEDTSPAWQALVRELRRLDCTEQITPLVGKLLSREDRQPSDWHEMALCQMETDMQLTRDCLYHQLHEDLWSAEAEKARAILGSLEYEKPRRLTHRLPLLVKRARRSWDDGNVDVALQQFRRAFRMMDKPEEIMCEVAELLMVGGRVVEGVEMLVKALEKNPKAARVMCDLALVSLQCKQQQEGMAWFDRAGEACCTARDELFFLKNCWMANAWGPLDTYLGREMKKTPHRTLLCNLKGALLFMQGEKDEARECWRRSLAVAPDDRAAAAYIGFMPTATIPVFPPWQIPQEFRQVQQVQFVQHLDENLLRPGSVGRSMLDWFAHSELVEEQKLALGALMQHPDEAEVSAYYRELLATPGVPPLIGGQAMVHLAATEPGGRVLLLMDHRYVAAPCRLPEPPAPQEQWRTFLTTLLKETRHYRRSQEIAEFSATLWRAMPPELRLEAATTEKYLWCKGFEVLWLRMTGQEQRAARLVTQLLLSPRRLSRVLRRLGHALQYDPALPEKEDLT